MTHVKRTTLFGCIAATLVAFFGVPFGVYDCIHHNWWQFALNAGLTALNTYWAYDMLYGKTLQRSREIDAIKARRDERLM